MIGIDTNILLRLWLDDDPAQNQRSDAFLAERENTPRSFAGDGFWRRRCRGALLGQCASEGLHHDGVSPLGSYEIKKIDADCFKRFDIHHSTV